MPVVIHKALNTIPIENVNQKPSSIRIDLYPDSKILSVALDNVAVLDIVKLIGQALTMVALAGKSPASCNICKYKTTEQVKNDETPLDWTGFESMMEVQSGSR